MILSLLARPNAAPVTVAISNLGQANISRTYGPFELEEISFVTAIAAFSGIFAVAALTFNSKMTLNFMFSQPSISQATMEILAEHVVIWLADASQVKGAPA